MRLAKGRIGLYSAFRQLYLAFADFCEIRPYISFVEMRLAKGKIELHSTFRQLYSGPFSILEKGPYFCVLPALFPSWASSISGKLRNRAHQK
jgi:hypothetical protein